MQSVSHNPRLLSVSLPPHVASPNSPPLTLTEQQPTPGRTVGSTLAKPDKLPPGLQRTLAGQPSPADAMKTPAEVVANQFATRPSVRTVVATLLNQALKSQYPTLNVDSANTSLAVPLPTDSVQYQLTPLLDLALEHLAGGAPLNFSAGSKWVKSDTGTTLRVVDASGNRAVELDRQAVELAIRSLRPNLKAAFAEALSQYWGQDAFADTNRWRWLSDTLNDSLRTAGLQQPGLDPQQRETLDQVTRYPDAAERRRILGDAGAQVYMLDTTLKHTGTASSVHSPDLLITRQVGERQLVLHASAAGMVTPYASLDDFAVAMQRELGKRFSFDHLSWQRTAPDGNIFDSQAAVILDQQLQNLEVIKLPTNTRVDDLEQLFAAATDTAAVFSHRTALSAAPLERMKRTLPEWLAKASNAERFSYQRNTLALASSVARNQGRTFATGLPELRTYAEQQLDAQLAPKGYSAKDLEITFKVPVGNLGGGYIEPIKMSLVDMALENLAGLPKGTMEIRLRGQRVEDPQLPQMLKDLISTVDIGQHYPALLNDLLLSDTPQARERAALFVEQVPLQLLMQAQELKLKGQAGITAKGCQLVEAALRPGVGPRQVEGQEITLRPLAFLRKPGATPDVVANMFVIEPKDPQHGPHLLYRPQLAPPLQEFASREALLAAIQAPGPLQQSILAWLPDDKARAVYGNGGFSTPHIAHYGQFNEFDPPSTPAPTALAVDGYAAADALHKDLLDGKLMQHLYKTNAQSLVTLAHGQSTSDAQSRWASHKALGWLLFNTLLPVLRGPGAMVGWLLQLANVESDIKNASDSNTLDPTAAMVDLLVNVATLLSHATPATAPKRPVGNLPFNERPEVSNPLRRITQEPADAQILIEQQTPAADGLIAGNRPFDFAFSSPRELSAAQRRFIESFSVPEPAGRTTPINTGATAGLFTVGGKLHARIEGRWYRVARDLDGMFVIDPQDKSRVGPALTRDAKALWQFDTRPKLKGGMPKSNVRIKATVNRNIELSKAMLEKYADEAIRMQPTLVAMEMADKRVMETDEALDKSDKTLTTLWGLVTSGDRGGDFAARYELELKKNQGLRALLRMRFEDYQRHADSMIARRKNAIQALTSDNPAMDFSLFREKRGDEYQAIAETLRSINHDYLYISDEFSHAPTGEPLGNLIERTQRNDAGAYATLIESMAERVERLERLIKANTAYTTLLETWKNDSTASKKQAEVFLKNTRQPPANQLLTASLERLSTLRELSLDRNVDTQSPEEEFFRERFNRAELNTVSNSHIELQQHEGYTADERIAVLSNLIDKYQGELSNTQALQETGPESVRPVYGQLFIEGLQDVIAKAQAELADLIREEQHLPPVVPNRKDRARKSHNKKVFKTRDKQTLVGTLRPTQPGQELQIIDVLDNRTGQPLSSYSWHPSDGEWVQIVRGEPIKPAPVPSPKPLSTYIGSARKLIEEQAGIERSIQFQKKKLDDPARRESVNPSDWSDMLEAQARRLEQVAQEAQASHGNRTELAPLLEQWQTAAKDMRQHAVAHRCDGYLRQAPRAENIDYLFFHGRVDIDLVSRGTKLKGGDTLTEYAVREKNGLKVLWYAHFHYPTAATPRGEYSAAHLKIPEQRYLTQKDLVSQAGQDNKRIDSIVRTQIKPPLDQKLFLAL